MANRHSNASPFERDSKAPGSAATPKSLVDKISKDVATALNDPGAKERLFNVGALARPSTPEQYGKFFDSEMTRWAKVIKDGNIKLD